MVHLCRQCERIEHSCPFGSLMRTEEERAPSGHGEVAVHPFDEIVVKCSVPSLEDADHRLPFFVEVAGGIGIRLTYVLDLGGNLPNEDHCLFMRAKLSNFSREDAVAFAHDNGIQRPDAIIREVSEALKQFRPTAEKNGVGARWVGRVESTILDHLSAWGEYDKPTESISTEVNGHKISDIRIEQTYKGNYHLIANIDGAERKFVIGKNIKEYAEIERTGIANITSDRLIEMAKRFFSSTLDKK